MRLASFLLALLPAAAAAEDATRHAWGAPAAGHGPSVVSVAPCPSPCFAVVTFQNTLVRAAWGGSTEHATLSVQGVVVAITVEQNGGRVPDRLRVLPPLGYVAQPGEILVGDGASGTIEVALVPMS